MAASFDLIKRHGGADRLREAAVRSPDIRAQIEAEIAEIKGINPQRCVVTQEYRDALQRALV